MGGDLSELSDNHIYVVITLIHGVEGSPLILFKSNTKRIKSFAVKGLFTLDKRRVKIENNILSIYKSAQKGQNTENTERDRK